MPSLRNLPLAFLLGTAFGAVLLTSGPASAVDCHGVSATIVGTDGNDTLTGGAAVNVIVGKGGNDTISGLGGNDIICGGGGADTIFGGIGNDYAEGNDGVDTSLGEAGVDNLVGNAQNDTLDGGVDDDILEGGSENDLLTGAAGDDDILGNGGTDTVSYGSSPASVVVTVGFSVADDGFGTIDVLESIEGVKGSPYDDSIVGTRGPNTVSGESGTDSCPMRLDDTVTCESSPQIVPEVPTNMISDTTSDPMVLHATFNVADGGTGVVDYILRDNTGSTVISSNIHGVSVDSGGDSYVELDAAALGLTSSTTYTWTALANDGSQVSAESPTQTFVFEDPAGIAGIANCAPSNANKDPNGAMGVVAAPGKPYGFHSDFGVLGWSSVGRQFFLDSVDTAAHVESVSLWLDPNNVVEYGWAYDRGYNNLNNLRHFTTRAIGGAPGVTTYRGNIPAGNHKFTIISYTGNRSGSNYVWDFRLDGNTQLFHENVPFYFGHPNAWVEIKNQCQDGHGRMWGLQRQNASGEWKPWTYLHWTCDGMKYYRYQPNSTTDFSSVRANNGDTHIGIPIYPYTIDNNDPHCEHMY